MGDRGGAAFKWGGVGALVGALLTAASPVEASPTPAADSDGPRFSVASDVIPWGLGGFSVIGMFEPAPASPWRVSVEAWGFEVPTALIELESRNVDEGWRRRIDYAVTLYGDYHLARDGQGAHLGLAVNGMHSTVDRGGDEAAQMWTMEVVGRGGYRYFPRADWGLFVNPWFGLGYLHVVQSPACVWGERFVESMFQLLGTMHVGWRI